MKKRPKRTEVSIKSETYERLKEEAEKRGITITSLVNQVLEGEIKCQADSPE